jgi:hypothetical protein
MGEKHADMWLSLHPAPKMKTPIAGLLGVLAAGPTSVTIEVEDVDGGPPGGAGGRSDSGYHRS